MSVILSRVTLLFLGLLVFFQNCSQIDFLSLQSKSPFPQVHSLSGGQPYDGKTFVEFGECRDQSSVKARILLNSSSQAYLLRDNCQDMEPRILAIGEFVFDPNTPDQILFDDRNFVAERSAQELSKLTPGYLQWFGELITLNSPSIYFVHIFDYTSADIQRLKASGHTVFCMITAGVYTSRDPDAAAFLPADLGKNSTAEEVWLDTRSSNVRAIMRERLKTAVSKGCQGIMWDQTDAFLSDSGFPLTAETAVDYAQFLAHSTHNYKLSVALSNTSVLSPQLVDFFDLSIGEGCFSKGICDRYQPFLDRGKPVLQVETGPNNGNYCAQAQALSISLWYGPPRGDGSRNEPCP